MDINQEKDNTVQQIVKNLDGKLKHLPDLFSRGGRPDRIKSRFPKEYDILQRSIRKYPGIKISDIYEGLGVDYERLAELDGMEDEWEKQNALTTIYGWCNSEVLYKVKHFLIEGWPPNAHSKLPTEYNHVLKQKMKYNKKHNSDVTMEDVFTYLGADYSMQNNPYDRPVLLGLWEIMEIYGTIENINETAPLLHKAASDRAEYYQLPIDKYYEELGDFEYTKVLTLQEIFDKIRENAGENKAISITDPSISDHFGTFKRYAGREGKTVQEYILESTGVHIDEEMAITADPIEFLKELLTAAGESGDLAGLSLRNPPLYYKVNYQFEISDPEIKTMDEFMEAFFKPDFYITGIWANRGKKKLMPEEQVLEILRNHSRGVEHSYTELRAAYESARRYAKNQGFPSARGYYEHHGIKITGAKYGRSEGERVKTTLENFTAPIGEKEIDGN